MIEYHNSVMKMIEKKMRRNHNQKLKIKS